ncbi:MAG TPA: aldose 1-epimerase, partial [Pirellulales bacterium]|nr:aldose 1-epimerase [Pirellulales bacterium]
MSAEVVTIADETGSTQARVMPGLGFNCFSFAADIVGKRVEALWSDPEFAGGEKRPTRSGIPILFPFAGRLRGTTYRFAGREYTLERGDDFGNAIHGFVVRRPWRLVERSADAVTGEFHAAVDDPAILERWPSDFRIQVTYRVQPKMLRADVRVDNPGSGPLPFGLGFHQYFRVPLARSGSGDHCRVQVPVGEHWELLELLPIGHRAPDPAAQRLAAGMKFGDMRLDDVFTAVPGTHGTCIATVA